MKRVMFLMIVALLLFVSMSHGATVKPMSVEELSRAANTVVEARVLQQWSQWDDQHSFIYTYTRLAVTDTWKGTAPLEIVVKQPGGAMPGYVTRVPGVRLLVDGEKAVLFLRPSSANDGAQVVVGLMQGHFRVYQSGSATTVSNGMPQASAISAGKIRPFLGHSMRLDELKSRVGKAVEQ